MQQAAASILLLAMIMAATPAALAVDHDVIARMGEHALTARDVRQLLASHPEAAANAQALERFLRVELVRRGVAAEARKQGLDKRPEVAARLERAAEVELVSAYVNDLARPPRDYPSEAQLKAAYEANQSLFKAPAQFRLSQIYAAGTDDKARKSADDLYRQARRKGADFAELARGQSKHTTSAAKGGDMGWLAERDLMPTFRKAVESLKKGEIAPPVPGPDGFHILLLADRKEAETLPLDKVRDGLTRTLRLRKAQEIEAAYLDGLLARTPIAVNGIALAELLPKAKE